MKININFPITGDTLTDCLRINDDISHKVGSVIRFGAMGNSSPHVTLFMGDIDETHITSISTRVRNLAQALPGPIQAEFGPPYRETVTGRYIFSDISVPDMVTEWRSCLRNAVSEYFVSGARMTEEELHLTLGVLEAPGAEIDSYLVGQFPLSPSIFHHIEISMAGAKGAKTDILYTIDIDND